MGKPMTQKTSLDRKIAIFKEYLERWDRILAVLIMKHKKMGISPEKKLQFHKDIDWCVTHYSEVSDLETRYVLRYPEFDSETSSPLIMSLLSDFQFLVQPEPEDFEKLKTGRVLLKAKLGELETSRETIGEIKIEDYERLKSLIERYRLESSSIDSLFRLAENSDFLGVNFNWILATISLQVQEVAMTLTADKLGFKLDKPNVVRILGKKIDESTSFKSRYEAFCIEIKRLKNISLSKLPSDLREMRTRVLHQGVSPSTSETKLLTEFTCAFLKELNNILTDG
jgi:hypothetical protein